MDNKKDWSKLEELELEKLFSTTSVEELSILLNRSIESIRNKAKG